MRRIASILVVIVLAFSMVGCDESKQIDKSAIAETVVLSKNGEETEYTFFLLTNDDKPKGISIEADSFQNACYLAKEKYIPNLSLAKLELFVINENLYKSHLKADIKYISQNSNLSPLINICLCDDKTVDLLGEDKSFFEEIERLNVLQKNKEKELKLNSLAIFNSFYSHTDNDNNEFAVSYISFKNELMVSSQQIRIKNENNIKNDEK